MPLFTKSMLKIWFNKNRRNLSSYIESFPVTLKAPFLTLTKLTNNQTITKLTMGKMKPSSEIISSNSVKLNSDSLYEAFLWTTETPVHFICFLGALSSRDYSLLFICSWKIAFCLGASTQYQHFTTSKWTHPKRFNKNHIRI